MNFARQTLLLAVVLGLLGCARDDAQQPDSKVLLVGVDGLEWSVLVPLMKEGRCPNLRSLMERGSYGYLETMRPTLSPILWTTIATGRKPEEHGIKGFIDLEKRPYTSSRRKVRALWDIVGQHGKTASVFGWWITWPVEPISGLMVSGSSSPALLETNWKPALLPGQPQQVHPDVLEDVVMEIAQSAGSLEVVQSLKQRFFGDAQSASLGPVEKDLIHQTMWSIQSDATYAAVAARMIEREATDLMMVYFGTPDVAGHRFWRYYEPGPFRWPHDPNAEKRWLDSDQSNRPFGELFADMDGEIALSRVIPDVYEWFDEQLGSLLEVIDEHTNVIVVSDHGMHADFTTQPHPLFLSGHHLDAAPGVIIAAGPDIAFQGGADDALAGEDELSRPGNILSVAPTVLAILGIPSSREFERQPPIAILEHRARANASLSLVDSHDAGFREAVLDRLPEEMESNFIRRFQDLGYIGLDEDEDEKQDEGG